MTAINKLTYIVTDPLVRLEKFWRILWRILTFSLSDETFYPKKNISVSIEKDCLHIVYGSRFLSRINIKGYRKITFEPKQKQTELVASSVAIFMDEFKTGDVDVSLIIPKDWSIVKVVEFPSTVRDHLSDVVYYELDRLTPFTPENAIYDYRILKDMNGKLSVLLGVARADLVNPYIESLKEKDINVNRVSINLSTIGTLARYVDKGMSDFVFVDIGNSFYEGALFIDGIITDTFRGTCEGCDEKTKAEIILKDISSYTEIFKNKGKKYQGLFLLRDKNPVFKETFRLLISMPYKFLDEIGAKISPKDEASYAATGGLLESLWIKSLGLNLLKRGKYEVSKPPLLLSAIFAIFLLCIGIIYMISPLYVEKQKIKDLDRQIVERKEEVKKIEDLKKNIESIKTEIAEIRNFKAGRPMALDILRELTIIIPRNAWLTRVRVGKDTVDIEGYAASASELIPKLEASKYFKKVEFSSPTFRDIKMNADRFSIKMEMEMVKREIKKEEEEFIEENEAE